MIHDLQGLHLDSRGLARALVGDYAGAIADFVTAAQRMKTLEGYDEYASKRESWVKTLQAGDNPFDSATLAELRNE